MMSEIIEEPAWAALDPSERATAQRLVAETLRHLGPADHVLGPLLERKPPARTMNLLRMGVVELLAGGAAHGVVNDAVNLARSHKKSAPMKGLVNAVLRRVAGMDAQDWAALPPTRLPRWLRRRLVDAWGDAAVAAMEAVQSRPPPTDLSVKSDPAEWASRLGGQVLPTGSVRLASRQHISSLAGFEDGAWWVQDAAAALPAKLLGEVKGQRVLDLCAAPGGKTMQLAAQGAHVTALDISERRMARLGRNLERTGLRARAVVADARSFVDAPFDGVLLDAPCSATGTIRRHPDLPHVKTQDSLGTLVPLQAQLLDHAIDLVRPGGALVFCTCSLLPEEGEAHVSRLIAERGDIAVETVSAPGIEPRWRSPEGGIRIRPDHWAEIGGLDGFYMALLRRAG